MTFMNLLCVAFPLFVGCLMPTGVVHVSIILDKMNAFGFDNVELLVSDLTVKCVHLLKTILCV